MWKETINFLALKNIRDKYLKCDVIQLIETEHFIILCKHSRYIESVVSWASRGNLVRLFKMKSKFVTFFLIYVFVVKMIVVDSQSQTTVSL